MIRLRPATMAVALTLVLMSTGVAVGAQGGCEGGQAGFCAPVASRAPLVWWDLSNRNVNVGVGQAEVYIGGGGNPGPPVHVLNVTRTSVDLQFGTVEVYIAAAPPVVIVSAGKVLRSVCVARLSPLRCPNR